MYALTIPQPFATLLMCGAKHVEPRNYTPRMCGAEFDETIAIHAAQKRDYLWVCSRPPFEAALSAAGYERAAQLPFGCVLGLIDIDTVHPVSGIRAQLSEAERAFGPDYLNTKYAWCFSRPRRFVRPIAAYGNPKLWEWEPEAALEFHPPSALICPPPVLPKPRVVPRFAV